MCMRVCVCARRISTVESDKSEHFVGVNLVSELFIKIKKKLVGLRYYRKRIKKEIV